MSPPPTAVTSTHITLHLSFLSLKTWRQVHEHEESLKVPGLFKVPNYTQHEIEVKLQQNQTKRQRTMLAKVQKASGHAEDSCALLRGEMETKPSRKNDWKRRSDSRG